MYLDWLLYKNVCLEAFSVDNGWTAFIVFLLGDPHLLEGGEGSQDGSSDPYGVFSFWWSNDLGLGWRGWFSAPTSTPVSLDPNKSFSELLVNFLEENSATPGTHQGSHLPAFPVNEIVGDIGRKNSLSTERDSGIEGRTMNYGNPIMAPMMPSSQKHQNALLKGLLDDQ